MEKITAKKFTLAVLNGLASGVVLALIPSALTSSLIKLLLPQFANLAILNTITGVAACLLPVFAAFCLGHLLHFSPLQSASVAVAALMGSGIVRQTTGGFVFSGTGDVVNIALVLALASGLVLIIGDKFGSYTILLLPLIVMWSAGLVGMALLPWVKLLTAAIGSIVNHLTVLQPHLMGTMMGVIFACMIVSPISSVGIATAVGLSGVASGSANLGITAAAVTLAVVSWSQNGVGVSLAHFLGTPKIQMANMLAHPKLFVLVAISGGLNGFLGATLNITGTPLSAGFGASGLIGPLAALPNSSWLAVVVAFGLGPVVIALGLKWLLVKKWRIVDAAYLRLEVK